MLKVKVRLQSEKKMATMGLWARGMLILGDRFMITNFFLFFPPIIVNSISSALILVFHSYFTLHFPSLFPFTSNFRLKLGQRSSPILCRSCTQVSLELPAPTSHMNDGKLHLPTFHKHRERSTSVVHFTGDTPSLSLQCFASAGLTCRMMPLVA